MTKLAAICGTALALCVYAAPAHAQATRTWVSGVGDDLNPCSRTAPCKTFAGAISKTATNGEINCLDNGAFGAVTIGKALTIKCETNEAGVLATLGSNGIIVNAPATDVVTLIGMDIFGANTGLNGVRYIAGAALHIVNSKIHGFGNASGNGILVNPTAGTLELYVSDSFIGHNGGSSSTGGINIAPTGTGAVRASINRSQIENNTVGIRVSGTATTGAIRVAAKDNMITGSANTGVIATASTAVTTTFLKGNMIFANNVGINSDGANSFMSISGNTITGNLGIGMSCTASCGGLQSFVNNDVNSNAGGDGATSGANLLPK